MKKSRKKKSEIVAVQDKLWEHCKRLVRAAYVKDDGSWDCFACGKRITEKSDAHTSHFIPDSTGGAFLRYDLRNLRVSCLHCNKNLGGNLYLYGEHLKREKGQAFIDQLYRDKNKTVKALDHYKMLLEQYSQL